MHKIGAIDLPILGKTITLYHDKYMELNQVLIGRKSKELDNPGFMWVPNENFKDSKPVKMPDPVNDEPKERPKLKIYEIDFILCNMQMPDDEVLAVFANAFEKIINEKNV